MLKTIKLSKKEYEAVATALAEVTLIYRKRLAKKQWKFGKQTKHTDVEEFLKCQHICALEDVKAMYDIPSNATYLAENPDKLKNKSDFHLTV